MGDGRNGRSGQLVHRNARTEFVQGFVPAQIQCHGTEVVLVKAKQPILDIVGGDFAIQVSFH